MSLQLYDELQVPLLAVNKKQELIYFNNICSIFFKLPPRKLKKISNILELFSVKGSDISKLITKTIASKAAQVSSECSLILPESDTSYTVIFKVIPHEEGAIIQIDDFSIESQLHLKYKDQLNELKETHQEILRSDKLRALGELTSGISHEIASPLTIVSDLILQIDEKLALQNAPEFTRLFDSLKSEFNRINQIIGNMQQAAKNNDDHYEIVCLSSIINRSIEFLNDLKHTIGITINITSDKNQFVLINPIKIEQVLINLIKNAIDALKNEQTKDPKIDISLSYLESESSFELDIKDNGPGIKEELREKVFDMFFTTKGDSDGTGLGLPICQKTMESHNGQLTLENSQIGAHFKLMFPSLELQSFTDTNKYFAGKSSSEDPIIYIYSKNVIKLNLAYQLLSPHNYVLILSSNTDDLESNADFYLAEHLVLLDEYTFKEQNEYVVMDLSELKGEDFLDHLEDEFIK